MAKPHPTTGAKLARRLSVDLTIMAVIGVVLALIGPFGSFAVPLPLRLASWLGFAFIGYAIYSPMGAVVERLHRALELPRLGLWIVACLVASVPMAAVVWVFNFSPSRPVIMPTLEQALTHYSYVLIIGGGVTALFQLIENSKVQAAPSEAIPAPEVEPERQFEAAPAPKFMDRLPPALGSDLIALEMEDHYVRAHTALGSELVLMRMRDAVGELDGMDGMQVHRSWWIARGGVEGMARDGRNIRLRLTGGLEAPVSRANVQPLKDAGWI